MQVYFSIAFRLNPISRTFRLKFNLASRWLKTRLHKIINLQKSDMGKAMGIVGYFIRYALPFSNLS